LRQHKNRDQFSNGYGNGGDCICETCNITIPHQRGRKCIDLICPQCGKLMSRKVPGEQINTSSTITSNRRVAIIIEEDCTGCGNCITDCPFDAIIMKNNKAFVIEDLCKGCMKCARVCPTQAIKRV